MKRFLLTALGAATVLLAADLALVEKVKYPAVYVLLAAIAIASLVAMSLRPEKEPKPLHETLAEAWVATLRAIGWVSLLEVEILGGLIAVIAIMVLTLPKAFLVFFAYVVGVGVLVMCFLLATLGSRNRIGSGNRNGQV